MKLSKRERDIIHCVQHRSKLSVSELSNLLPYKEHSIRFTLNSLLEKKVFTPYTLIDLFRLGYSLHNFYFSFSSHGSQSSDKILSVIQAYPRVIWLAELGGNHEYELTFASRKSNEFTTFIEELSDNFGPVFEKKISSIENLQHYYGEKYLTSCGIKIPVITTCETDDVIEVDELDRKILRTISPTNNISNRSIRRQIGVPASTIDYRRQRLIDQGVIRGEIFILNQKLLDINYYHFCINTRNTSNEFSERLFNYCEDHSHISFVVRCVGAWDFKLGISAEAGADIADVLKKFRNEFDKHIASIEIYSVFSELKFDHCPF